MITAASNVQDNMNEVNNIEVSENINKDRNFHKVVLPHIYADMANNYGNGVVFNAKYVSSEVFALNAQHEFVFI